MLYFNRKEKKGYEYMEHTNNNTIRAIYKQLSESERIKIAQLYLSGLSIREISRRTSRSPSTISREIRRNGRLNQPSMASQRAGRSTHLKAQRTRDERFVRPKSLERFNKFIDYANNAIDPFVTLEDIYWNFQKKFPSLPCPCLKSIYNWAHKGIIKFSWGEKPIKKLLKNQIKSLLKEEKQDTKEN